MALVKDTARYKKLAPARNTGRVRAFSASKAPRLPEWLSYVLLAAVTAVVYGQVAHYPFTNYDDTGYIVENQHVQAGVSWSTVVWAFTSIEQANWHPLTWLSHAFDCQIYGLDAGGHHATSLVIDVVNVLLL